ncbi:MAG TPA: primosomal protein N' [Burkholderiales bacterium]|nr:primosomal protein N' [Burkholderiales bacterium]
MTVAKVALDIPLDRLFDYLASDASAEDVGRRILVPFGGRKLVGVIHNVAQTSDLPAEKLRPAIQIFRDALPLDSHALAMFEFCRNYYHHPIGEVIMNALPPGLRRAKPVFGKSIEIVRLTEAGRAFDVSALPVRAIVKRKLLGALQTNGVLRRDEISAISPQAVRLLPQLAADELISTEKIPAGILGASAAPSPEPSLSSEQGAVVSTVLAKLDSFSVNLLHGVTGSGKTEVYLRLVKETLARGKQALVLVPEINLTPQLESVFRARFPGVSQVSLHSHLAEGERVNHYLAAQSGQARIVLGTRLAIFTPLPQLGLIVVDEEHDNSFKQQDGLRYSARDVAIYRAKQLGIPVILGSATPSLESYHNANTQRFHLLQLNSRAVPEASLPEVKLIVTEKKQREGVSQPVLEALRQRLERGEQSLVFINRRGYAPVLLCPQCGWISCCSRCSAKLTLHARNNRLRCHHCGLDAPSPAHCPSCGNADLRGVGQGTQRVEAWLTEQLPTARILRVDRDTVASKATLASFIERVHADDVDILVGTQMLAKGHDFPKLTLVAVINADGSLYSGDFRAEEKLFAQLMQVAGRAGRAGIPGEVLVQTAFPEHPLFAALKRHNFAEFANLQLQVRREAHFPPYTFHALLRVESLSDEAARDFTQQCASIAKPLAQRVHVFDAVPAPIARIAGRSRWQLLIQANSRSPLQRFLHEWRAKLEEISAREVRWAIDVDPLEL